MAASQQLLKNVYLFKDLTPTELDQISAIGKVKVFTAGDIIFGEGDEAHSLCIIKYGTVRIHRSSPGETVEVAQLGTGAHFGEMAFVDGEARSATVVAVERSEIVEVEFAALKAFFDKHPEIAVKVYRAFSHFLCGRLRVTTMDLSFAREKNIRHF